MDAHRKQALAWTLVVSLVLWNWPQDGLALYPFKLLATWIHESSHGLVMFLTGAGFSHMEIFADTAGLAYQVHGVNDIGQALISSAGYMGTPVFGAFIFVFGSTPSRARVVLIAMAVLLGLSAWLAVSNDFGMQACGIWAGSCLLLALLARGPFLLYIINFIALQSCINALLDIRVLFRPHMMVNGIKVGLSDAHIMAKVTFGTPTMWAIIWMAWSVLCLFVALRLVRLAEAAAQSHNNANKTDESEADGEESPQLGPQWQAELSEDNTKVDDANASNQKAAP